MIKVIPIGKRNEQRRQKALSRFSSNGWASEEIPKPSSVERVFRRGVKLTHVYDFGTESVTTLRCLQTRVGRPVTRYPIALMVRNKLPDCRCIECGAPAKWLCVQCVVEDDIMGFLCKKHLETHPHEDYGEPVSIVNSPRLGLCGYTGPAKPPY